MTFIPKPQISFRPAVGDVVVDPVDDDERDSDDGCGRERRVVSDQRLTDRLGDQQQQDEVEDRDLHESAPHDREFAE